MRFGIDNTKKDKKKEESVEYYPWKEEWGIPKSQFRKNSSNRLLMCSKCCFVFDSTKEYADICPNCSSIVYISKR